MKSTSYHTGIRAESIALAFLQRQGMECLKERYRTPYGEIDLIMLEPHGLVFVEVKARTTLEEALLSIHPRQQQRIMEAALHYVSQHVCATGADAPNMRFDVVAIDCHAQVQHLAHAWDAS